MWTTSGGELLKLETGQARAAFELVREVGSVNLVPTQAPCGFLCARVPRTLADSFTLMKNRPGLWTQASAAAL